MILTVGIFLTPQHVAMDIRHHCVSIDRQLGLKKTVSERQTELIEHTLKT